MLPREIVKQVRRLQVKARRAVEDMLGGEYHSRFKGAGIAFDEVRPYQPGDDVRAIDWNVTARMGEPFLKRYVEERERTLVLALDASASLRFGTGSQSKREVAAELAALIALSASANNDRVGLVQFTSGIEQWLPPRKGTGHVLRIIREALFFQPRGRGTDLAEGLAQVNRLLKRRAIVFLFSDFLDDGYARAVQRTARRHELVAVRIGDAREDVLPEAGLVQAEDAETGQRLLIDNRLGGPARGLSRRRPGPRRQAAPPDARGRRRPGGGVHRRQAPRRPGPLLPPQARARPMTLLLLLAVPLDLGLREAGPIRLRLAVDVPAQGAGPGLAAVRLALQATGPATMQIDGPRLEDAVAQWTVRRAWSAWSPRTPVLERRPGPGQAPAWRGLPGVAVRVRQAPGEEWQELAWYRPLGETLGVAPPEAAARAAPRPSVAVAGGRGRLPCPAALAAAPPPSRSFAGPVSPRPRSGGGWTPWPAPRQSASTPWPPS